jgi:phosphonoacetaldehyde hydrolase
MGDTFFLFWSLFMLANPDVHLVVFDWAGTTVDFGCFAPVDAFVRAFARHGIAVTPAEVRGDMGLHKKDHLRALLRRPEVSQRWHRRVGCDWNDRDLESLYETLVPLQLEAVAAHTQVVPGLRECIAVLRQRGIGIGSTTGYFRAAAESLYEAARQQGFVPDCAFCADDVPVGRPAPWMIFRIMESSGVYPPCSVVKVGDTVPDIEEGRNAGVWSVAVTRSSSAVGCTEEELADLSEPQRQAKLDNARRQFLDAGAHAVIDSLTELPDLVDQFRVRLQNRERP